MGNEQVILLDRKDVPASQHSVIEGRGHGFITGPSQYDVPEAMRAYPTNEGLRIIEFKYIGPDEPQQVAQVQDMKIRTGRNSGRIYGLVFDPASYPGSDPRPLIEHLRAVVREFVSKPTYPRKANYVLIDAILAQFADQVLTPAEKQLATP